LEIHRINYRIRDPELRVIGPNGENLGIMQLKQAQDLAQEHELDLVVIAEKAKPPVAKILDYNKFLYEEHKKEAASKAKSKKSELKEFRISPKIGEEDLVKRIERSREFLQNGSRLKITVQLAGRQAAYPEYGLEKIKRIATDLADIAKMETEPKQIRNKIHVTFIKN